MIGSLPEQGQMATEKVAKELQSAIDDLVAERDELDEKIQLLTETLKKLGGSPRRGGRKPAKAKADSAPATKKKATRKKPNWSPEAKKAAAERMRKYWADRKKKEAGRKNRTTKKKG